jgi:hypothetical protein
MDEDMRNPTLGRGTLIVDDALTITQHAFFTADKLSLVDSSLVGSVTIELAPDSGTVRLQLFAKQQGGTPLVVDLAPDRYNLRPTNGSWVPHEGKPLYRLWTDRSGTWLEAGHDNFRVGGPVDGNLEWTARDGVARVRRIEVQARDGSTLVDETYDQGSIEPKTLEVGAWLGGAMGLALWIVLRGRTLLGAGLVGVGLSALPLWVSVVPFFTWLAWVERLYMSHTTAWELACLALGASVVPLILATFLALGVGLGTLRDSTSPARHHRLLWLVAVLLAAAWTSRGGPGLAWTALGAGFLALPGWLAWRDRIPTLRWLAWDLPALALVGGLGWQAGLLPAVLWRLVVLAGSAPVLRALHARPAADLLFILLTLLPVGGELMVRSTYLDQAWSLDQLTLELTSEEGRYDEPGWRGACGNTDATATNVVFTGGSSTGGDQQFRNTPEAFFPGQTHQLLCEMLPADRQLATWNFGRGGLDTHILARTLGEVLDRTDAHLLVLYVGVNDLLSRYQPLTRRQREERMNQWRTGLGGLQALSARVRLLVAGGLWMRPIPKASEAVANVPVQDARQNMEAIAQLTAERDAQLLLLTEYVQPELTRTTRGVGDDFRAYQLVQQQLATDHDHVHFHDVWTSLAAHAGENLLVDSNHLTRLGNQRVGQAIAPTTAQVLGLAEGTPRGDDTGTRDVPGSP